MPWSHFPLQNITDFDPLPSGTESAMQMPEDGLIFSLTDDLLFLAGCLKNYLSLNFAGLARICLGVNKLSASVFQNTVNFQSETQFSLHFKDLLFVCFYTSLNKSSVPFFRLTSVIQTPYVGLFSPSVLSSLEVLYSVFSLHIHHHHLRSFS